MSVAKAKASAEFLESAQARLRRPQAVRPGIDRVAPAAEGQPDPEGEWHEVDATIREAASARTQHYSQTLLPEEAIVSVAFFDAEEGFVSGRKRWFALFEITDTLPVAPECVGKILLRAYNAPTRPWLSPRHNLTQDWIAVTRLRAQSIPLKRPPRAVLGAFLRDCHVTAHTHVVARRMNTESKSWEDTPAESHYSVISRLGRVVAGCPRVLQQRKAT